MFGNSSSFSMLIITILGIVLPYFIFFSVSFCIGISGTGTAKIFLRSELPWSGTASRACPWCPGDQLGNWKTPGLTKRNQELLCNMYTYIYIYIYIIYIYINIYIYILIYIYIYYTDRDNNIYIYNTYTYVCIKLYIEREKQWELKKIRLDSLWQSNIPIRCNKFLLLTGFNL